jgi:hypothetical protein
MSGNRTNQSKWIKALAKRSFPDWKPNRLHTYFALRTKYVQREVATKVGVKFTKTKIPSIVAIRTPEVWTRIPHPANHAWSVAFRVVVQGIQPVVAEIRIFPTEADTTEIDTWSANLLGAKAKAPAGGITARLIKATRTGEAVRGLGDVAKEIQWWRKTVLEGSLNSTIHGNSPDPQRSIIEVLDVLSDVFPQERPRREKRHRGKPDLFYARLASEYTTLLNAGQRHPIAVIVERQKLERSKVRDMIRQARKRGLLSFDRPGYPGGQLTNYALKLLGQPEEPQEPKKLKKGARYGRPRSTKKR